MAVSFDDEDWERVKLGRFSDADEQLVHRVMGPWFLKSRRRRSIQNLNGASKRPKMTERQAQVLMSRGNTVALGINYTPRKQAIVKVGFCSKSRRGAVNQVLYMTRRRPRDLVDAHYKALPVWDGLGVPVEDEDIRPTVERWDLPSDENNLSKTARMLLEKGELDAFQSLGERERLRNILTWHFILSIEENGETMSGPFRAAVRSTVDATFTAHGHQTLWTIHADDTDHTHAHVIVKAKSDFGQRIHSDIHGDYLHHLRETFAGNLRRVGFEYEATRRVDRKALREEVMAGRALLRDEHRSWREGIGTGDMYANLPAWSQVHGSHAAKSLMRLASIRQQVIGITHQMNGPEKVLRATDLLKDQLDQVPLPSSWWGWLGLRQKKKVPSDNLTKTEWELLKQLEHMFHYPRQALESWRLMASDGRYRDELGKMVCPNRILAIWTLVHRPELFGLTKAGAYQVSETKRLKLLLKSVRLWAPEQLSKLGQGDNSYREVARRVRAVKDRAGVLFELGNLHRRIDNVWPEGRLARAVAQAIRQAERIELDGWSPNRNEPQARNQLQIKTACNKPTVCKPSAEGRERKPLQRIPSITPKPSVITSKPSTKSEGRER